MTTGYSITDQQLKLSKLQGKIFGGSITGDAELNQWLAAEQHLSPAAKKTFETAVISSAPPLSKSRQPIPTEASGVQSAVIDLRLRDISSEEFALAMNASAHPLPDFRLAGLASAQSSARWKGTRRDAENSICSRRQSAADFSGCPSSYQCARLWYLLCWHRYPGSSTIQPDHADKPCPGFR